MTTPHPTPESPTSHASLNPRRPHAHTYEDTLDTQGREGGGDTYGSGAGHEVGQHGIRGKDLAREVLGRVALDVGVLEGGR
jgi:hypothetical protein